MDNSPFEFVMSASSNDLKRVSKFVHRTFYGNDCTYFMKGLKHIYLGSGNKEDIVIEGMSGFRRS